MEGRNGTSVTEFIFSSLTADPVLQSLLFLVFLTVYVVTVVGNIGMASLIVSQSRLHSPMYFLLSVLSLSDFCYSSVVVPRMLKDLLSEKKSISFRECAAQTFFFALFAGVECYLLSTMAYDRYAAICHPLLYHNIVNRSVCLRLVAVVLLSGLMTAAAHTTCTFHTSFCGPNVIDHFYCDMPPLMVLSCSDTFVREVISFAVVFIFGFGSLLITITSYSFIISTILRIPSNAGRVKMFSTCGSHLTALALFYGTGLFMYLRLPGTGYVAQNKVLSMCYTIAIPLVNPLIYSLRNQEVKGVIWKMIHKKLFKHQIIQEH